MNLEKLEKSIYISILNVIESSPGEHDFEVLAEKMSKVIVSDLNNNESYKKIYKELKDIWSDLKKLLEENLITL